MFSIMAPVILGVAHIRFHLVVAMLNAVMLHVIMLNVMALDFSFKLIVKFS